MPYQFPTKIITLRLIIENNKLNYIYNKLLQNILNMKQNDLNDYQIL